MIDEAAGLADAIVEAEAALKHRRADLDNLATMLTNDGRRLNRVPPTMPPQVSAALYPADRTLDPAEDGLQ